MSSICARYEGNMFNAVGGEDQYGLESEQNEVEEDTQEPDSNDDEDN
jgi:hypothetical protein